MLMRRKIDVICTSCGTEWYGRPGDECFECGGVAELADQSWHPPDDCPCGCEGDVEEHAF